MNERALLCIVLARLEDRDRFREHMQQFVRQCGTSNNADSHHWAARISLLCDPTPRDVSMAVELAESATRPVVADPELSARLSQAAATGDASLLVSKLEIANGVLRGLLIELHAYVEELDSPEAKQIETAIWRELAASTERRKLSLGPF